MECPAPVLGWYVLGVAQRPHEAERTDRLQSRLSERRFPRLTLASVAGGSHPSTASRPRCWVSLWRRVTACAMVAVVGRWAPRLLAIGLVALVASCAGPRPLAPAHTSGPTGCVPAGHWVVPATRGERTASEVLAGAARPPLPPPAQPHARPPHPPSP